MAELLLISILHTDAILIVVLVMVNVFHINRAVNEIPRSLVELQIFSQYFVCGLDFALF